MKRGSELLIMFPKTHFFSFQNGFMLAYLQVHLQDSWQFPWQSGKFCHAAPLLGKKWSIFFKKQISIIAYSTFLN
jgi:hypothetical protein